MIRKLTHVTFYVLDQEAALQFYTKKLGFEVRMDVTMEGGFRWLTLGLKEQPDLEIILMEPKAGPMWDEETVRTLRGLIEKGAMGTGVLEADDCHKTYNELKDRGVEFLSPPEEKFYGIEALLKDNSGNWFSMTQHK
jgi:catechol 2,3-dioxygenase-like lactoylglutathione lyase family enzyme